MIGCEGIKEGLNGASSRRRMLPCAALPGRYVVEETGKRPDEGKMKKRCISYVIVARTGWIDGNTTDCCRSTYNSRASLVVTYPTTNLPVYGLITGKRVGKRPKRG